MDAVLTAPEQSDFQTLDMPEGYEQIDGRLVESNVGAKSAWVGGNVLSYLVEFCRQQKLGWALPSEAIYRCFANKKTARKPDASFIRFGRLADETLPDGEIKIAPDLAVEVVSPNDTYYEVSAKVKEYLAAGVRLVWVIDPKCREALAHRLAGSISRVTEGEELDGEDVMPGFRCALATCLPPPSHEGNGKAEVEA